MADEPRIYVYKLVSDEGGAPCVTDNLLSLSICKPAIRRTARVGDLIFGFGSNYDLDTRLVYAAKVTEKLVGGQYYGDLQYQTRDDAIYSWTKDGDLRWRKGATYHLDGSGAAGDIGFLPYYKNANTLLSTEFRYLGNLNYQSYPNSIRSYVTQLGQGHRVNLSADTYGQLMRLWESLEEKYPNVMKIGKPSTAHQGCKLNDDCGGCAISRNGFNIC